MYKDSVMESESELKAPGVGWAWAWGQPVMRDSGTIREVLIKNCVRDTKRFLSRRGTSRVFCSRAVLENKNGNTSHGSDLQELLRAVVR